MNLGSQYITSVCDNLVKSSDEQKTAIKEIERKVHDLEILDPENLKRLEQVEENLKNISKNIDECEKFLNILKNDVELLNDKKMKNKQSLNFEETKRKLIKADQFIGQYNIYLSEIDLRLQCLEQTNYDGTLLWKITNYDEQKRKAMLGQSTSIYSQPFFTARYGYKMCARIYLNGDGIGKGTHISLFFVLMKGDYDNILEWPFKYKVTMMLLDQSGNEGHIIDSFKPDPKSSSYQKPTSSFNVASGCPLFAEQFKLESNVKFLKNDCLFVKFIVKNSP